MFAVLYVALEVTNDLVSKAGYLYRQGLFQFDVYKIVVAYKA